MKYTDELRLQDDLFSDYYNELHGEFTDGVDALDGFNDAFMFSSDNFSEDSESKDPELEDVDIIDETSTKSNPVKKKSFYIPRKVAIGAGAALGAGAGNIASKRILKGGKLEKREAELRDKIRSGKGSQNDLREWKHVKSRLAQIKTASTIGGGLVGGAVTYGVTRKRYK